jgi:hypothetical protein
MATALQVLQPGQLAQQGHAWPVGGGFMKNTIKVAAILKA